VMAAPPAAPATEQPAAAPAAAPAPAVKAVREMDPQQVKLLMQQGEQFLAAGDVITARTVFQRAAEGGNAAAALALGATYDPEVLAKMGARGVNPDVQKARMWYERAKEYGSSDAPRRLEALVNR
jgi:TPR repeat protein